MAASDLRRYARGPDRGAFESVPEPLRPEARSRYSRLIAKWRGEGRPLTLWRLALAAAIAANLALHPRGSSAWGRRMLAARGGKASAASPRHYPIEKAREARLRLVAIRRNKRQWQDNSANRLSRPYQPNRHLPLD